MLWSQIQSQMKNHNPSIRPGRSALTVRKELQGIIYHRFLVVFPIHIFPFEKERSYNLSQNSVTHCFFRASWKYLQPFTWTLESEFFTFWVKSSLRTKNALNGERIIREMIGHTLEWVLTMRRKINFKFFLSEFGIPWKFCISQSYRNSNSTKFVMQSTSTRIK